MARGPVRIGGYDQRTTPQSGSQPYVRAADPGPGLGRAVANLGSGFADQAQADLAIERMRISREEDDARVYVSRAMAEARAQANQLRRTALTEAPDGWRGVTDRVSRDWGQLREQALSRAPTPSAQRFLTEAFDSYQPLLLEDVADAEHSARQSWRVDTVREAIRTEGSAIAAEPSLYGQAVSQQRELIAGMTDLDPNQRRDLLSAMEEEFAVVAVSGMIERNPGATLRELRNPEAGGAYEALNGSQRASLINRAQAEIDRRTAQWRTGVREQIATARDLWRLGEQAPNAPTVDSVRSALGDSAAAAYEIDLQVASASSTMQRLSTPDLVNMASAPPLTEGSERDRLDNIVRRRAAQGILEQRADPMAYVQREGYINTEGFMEALQQQSFATVGLHLRQRQAVSEEHRARLGRVPLLSAGEASAMRTMLDRLPTTQQRQAALENMRNSVTPQAFSELTRQLYPDAPGAQLGAMVQGRSARLEEAPSVTGEVASRRLLDGAAALGSVQQQNTPGEGGADRARRTFAMPSDADLRRAWINEVGDAYRGMPRSEAAAFEAYRAAYAGTAMEAGDTSGQFNSRFAREAAAIATGGVMRQGEHRTVLPWGMSEEGFQSSLQRGWAGMQQRLGGDIAGQNPSRFRFEANGGGAYAVMTPQGAPALDANGRPIIVRVPGPAQ